jgi:hypothetical protein
VGLVQRRLDGTDTGYVLIEAVSTRHVGLVGLAARLAYTEALGI